MPTQPFDVVMSTELRERFPELPAASQQFVEDEPKDVDVPFHRHLLPRKNAFRERLRRNIFRLGYQRCARRCDGRKRLDLDSAIPEHKNIARRKLLMRQSRLVDLAYAID